MANLHTLDAGGGGVKININVDEITSIYQKMEAILVEFENNIFPADEQIGNLNFYEAGKAKKAMEVYKEANAKVTEIYNHYDRASTLVIDTLNQMMAADREIALQIIEKLEL